MDIRSIVLAAIAALIGCAEPTFVPPRAVPPDDYQPLRQSVAALADAPCGRCHDGVRSTAKPGALAIFDLADDRWQRRMTPRQLDFFAERIEGDVSEADMQVVLRFIGASKARRLDATERD